MTSESQADQPLGPSNRGQAPARSVTLVLANLTKLAGLVVAVHEAFTARSPVVMAVAAFMMAGAQISETLVLGVIERFFGRPQR